MFTVEVEPMIAELGTRWVNVRAAIRAGMRRGVSQGVREGALEAKTKHRFVNRTGALERSIAGRVTGSSEDEHRGEIVATMHYASYVENGRGPVTAKNAPYLVFKIDGRLIRTKSVRAAAPRPFLAFAYSKCEAVMIREIERGLSQAQAILDR